MRAAILAALLLSTRCAVTDSNPNFVNALVTNGPDREHASEMTLYDALIGDWDADVIDYRNDGTRLVNKGEWHFAWVLEGRAIQDVWIVPPRAIRQVPLRERAANRYGTSMRVFDPATHVWNVTWINPVSGAFNRLVGHRQGNDIVQEGHDDGGRPMRWTFSDITANSFRWRGEVSEDGGRTWRLAAEFIGRRQKPMRK